MKSLLPSFILILLYFIAEEFFGPKVGLIAVIVLGAGEFFYSWIREKRINKMTLFNTLFFIALAAVSVLLEGTSFERIQQTIVEAAMCVLIGIFAFSKADMTQTLPESYRKTLQITPEQQQAMHRMLRLLFYLLVLHTVLAFTSAFIFDEEIHQFIEGPLLYILIALFFLTLFVKNRLLAKAASQDEWLPIVNEKGEVVGKATRRSCHSGSMLLHPVVHLHLINVGYCRGRTRRTGRENRRCLKTGNFRRIGYHEIQGPFPRFLRVGEFPRTRTRIPFSLYLS